MDFIASIWANIVSLFSYIVPFLFVLTIVVFFHELGHFSVARFFKTKIDVFSVGFGKEIFGWNDKHGTRWRVSWLPLGGYVKFFGDEGAASTPDKDRLAEQRASMTEEELAGCFHFKPLHQRAAIVAAGPFANFVLAIFIFWAFFWIIGETVMAPRVGKIVEGSAAEEAGLQPGDLITHIDGRPISSFAELQSIVSLSSDTELLVSIDRAGQPVELKATPRRTEDEDPFGNKINVGKIGFYHTGADEDVQRLRYGFVESAQQGVSRTWFIAEQTMVFLGRLVRGKEDSTQISGPLRIAQISGKVASIGIFALINLAAVLSVSIGLINLFPIPMLDGGHLMFYGYEAVAGKPLGERAQDYGFRIGLALVLCLMVFATWNDLVHLSLIPNIMGLLN